MSSSVFSLECAGLSHDFQPETERLLNGRIRDIKLSGALSRLYRDTSWLQRSKIIRAWAIWVSLIGLLFIPLSYTVDPSGLHASIVAGGLVCPIANLLMLLVWRKSRAAWVEGLSVVILVAVTVATYSGVGVAIGGLAAERYATGALFVVAVAIMVFAVDFVWVQVMAVIALCVFNVFILLNPYINVGTFFGLCWFYAMGMFAVLKARQTATILVHRSFLMALRDNYRATAMTEANQQLELLATRDPLTGLANRRLAADRIATIWNDITIAKSGVAFIMADIDNFKSLNDTAGHAAGDDCIARVARTIESAVRTEDIICRHGGEEFLVVLTNVTPNSAWEFAERIRAGVEAQRIINPGLTTAGNVTISLGVAFAANDVAPELVIKLADEALYDAKRAGRNRVMLVNPPNPDLATELATDLATDLAMIDRPAEPCLRPPVMAKVL